MCVRVSGGLEYGELVTSGRKVITDGRDEAEAEAEEEGIHVNSAVTVGVIISLGFWLASSATNATKSRCGSASIIMKIDEFD